MNFKNFSFLIAGVVLAGAGAVYAAAPSGGYAPNATLDPDCAPGDIDCFVQSTVDTNPWFGVTDNEAATSNTENIYTLGNIGVGTSSPLTTIYSDGTVTAEAFVNFVARRPNTIPFVGAGIGSIRTETVTGQDVSEIITVAGNISDSNPEPSLHFRLDSGDGNPATPSSDTKMVLLNNGNVGIGVTAPTAKLHVQGNIRVEEGNTTCLFTNRGEIRFDGTNFLGCNGTAWVQLDN